MVDFSTVLGPQKELTEDEFRDQIIPVLENILRKEFPNSTRRQTIKRFKDRLNFACPICGDSAHDDSKKRGNIILEGQYRNMYKCHNCGISMSLKKFFDRFGKYGTLSNDASMYLFTKKPVYDYNATISKNSDLLVEIQEIEELCVPREVLKERLGLIELDIPSKARNYLIGRHQFDFKKFLYSPYNDELFVLNLTPKGNIFALQIRSLKPNYNGPKYRTFCLSNIHETYLNETDVEKYKPYDSLSMLFNVLTVDYSRDVFVTEGPMDSFLIRNCIAACGGSKKIPLDTDMYYIYDYDEAGEKYAMDAMKEGRMVFLWKKFAEYMNLPKRKKWDWNDLVIYCSQNGLNIPNHTEFFSNDQLDMMFL
jgi:hypothetical protein